MLKPVLALAALGLAGFLLMPLFGAMLGLVFLLFKIALVIGAIWLLIRLFRKPTSEEPKTE